MDYQDLIYQHYPLHLQQHEVNDPMLVLTDFFLSDRLPGHSYKLKKWRDHVIGENYFIGKHANPGDLLMIYRDVVRLIEAAFLLNKLGEDFDHVQLDQANFEESIAAERNEWECHARHLNRKQLASPIRVIRKFCKAYSLNEYREYLHEWLIFGLSKHACMDLEPFDLITVYENLQILFEACWLIHQRHSVNGPIRPDHSILPAKDNETDFPTNSNP